MKMPASLAGSQVEFDLRIQPTGGNYFSRDLGTVTIPPTDASDIDFNADISISTVTWSGTISLTVNGAFPSGNVTIQAYDTSDNSWEYIGSSQVKSDDGTWSITVAPYSDSKQIVFRLAVEGSSGVELDEKSLPGTPQTGINLGTHSYITLSGSVAVTWNQSPFTTGNNNYINVDAYPNSDYSGSRLGEATVNASGNWTMLVESSSSARNCYFKVYVHNDTTGSSITKETGVSRSVSNSPIQNIALGTVVINTIALSGTVSGTVDALAPNHWMVAAYIAGENKVLGNTDAEPDGSWSMEVEALDSSKTVSFIVAPSAGNTTMFIRPSTPTRTVYNSNVSGIDITGLAITTKTVQIDITSNGADPVPGVVYICNSQIFPADMSGNDAVLLKVIAMPTNAPLPFPSTWSLKVPSDTGGVYFMVVTDMDSGEYYVSDTPYFGNTVTLNLLTMTKLSL
jgi:hypothetical protein